MSTNPFVDSISCPSISKSLALIKLAQGDGRVKKKRPVFHTSEERVVY
jgi:hypothetical protein